MPETLDLTGFALVLMRMTGCILLNPILGRRDIPALFKAGLILLLTIMTFSYSGVTTTVEFTNFVVMAVVLIKELFIGFTVGFICTLFASIIIMGGEVIDMQMGMTMSKIYDPSSNISMSLSGVFLNVCYMFMFFATNAHLTLIKIFITLGDVLPYGNWVLRTDITGQIIDIFCQCTVLGLKLAMPFIAIEIMLEVGVGILMKAIPQINVFVINIQMKMLVGLVLLLIIVGPAMEFFEGCIEKLFESITLSMTLLK